MYRVLFVLVLFLSVACSTPSQLRRDAEHFPKKAEIETLMKKEHSDVLSTRVPGKIVDTWELVGPLPTMIGETIAIPKTIEEEILAEATLKSPNIKMTDSMNCVARQYAAFFSVHKKFPFDSLRRFINARCGSLNEDATYCFIRVGKEGLEESLKKQLRGFLGRLNGKTGRNIGVFLSKDKKLLHVTTEISGIQLDPIPMKTEKDGTVKFSGSYKTKEEIERFSAQFNVGEFGVDRCIRQPVEVPKFSFVCKTNPNDRFSYLELGAEPKDAMYSSIKGNFMVFSEPINTYVPPESRRILLAAESKKDAGLPYLAELINRVRNSGGRRSIILEEEQSRVVEKLVPGLDTEDAEEKNKVLLSMLAGWEVNGEIVDTSFRLGYSDGTSAVSMLESLLESPGGRRTLLDKKVSALAVGTVSKPKRGIRFAFVSYDFLEEEHINKRISRVVDSLRRKRKELGSGKTKELTQFRVDAEKWAQDFRDGATFEAIENEMIKAFRYQYGSDKTLWYLSRSVTDLDEMGFSNEMLTDPNIEIMVTVTPYRPEGSPRTFYAVFFVYETK